MSNCVQRLKTNFFILSQSSIIRIQKYSFLRYQKYSCHCISKTHYKRFINCLIHYQNTFIIEGPNYHQLIFQIISKILLIQYNYTIKNKRRSLLAISTSDFTNIINIMTRVRMFMIFAYFFLLIIHIADPVINSFYMKQNQIH